MWTRKVIGAVSLVLQPCGISWSRGLTVCAVKYVKYFSGFDSDDLGAPRGCAGHREPENPSPSTILFFVPVQVIYPGTEFTVE